ncbi:C40 family peptidase [Nocardia jiangsuensis]|uniref:C40 family peptidase n=1 Tax=Nocardia jiangsuensis TaxID=1691563 RepID=A0ABV8DSM3_9NOCA
MTSAELWSIAEPVDAEGAEAVEGGQGERGAAVTPWSGQRGGRGGLPAVPAVSAVTAPAAPVSAPAPAPPGSVGIPGLPGITVPSALLPPALRPQTPGGAAVPGNASGVAAASGAAGPGVAGPGAAAPAAPAVAAPVQDPPPPAVDPDTLGAVLPAAATAGTMALGMLPTLAEALLGGGGGSAGTGGSAPATGGTAAPAGGTAAAAGLSPQDQRVLEVLKALVAAYGDGDTKDPRVAALRRELGSGSGTGSGAAGVKARQLYQANFANAYNTLDNQLAGYITRAAGNTEVDRTAIHNLLREVNVAVNELGTRAYTREGQQQVHKILTAALVKANAIAGGTHAGNTDTAAFINQLTAQYLGNIAGRKTPAAGVGGAGAPASGKVKTALDTARAQFGKPYVWGHEGPNSFDCSGLMQYAARAAGVKIPRVAADQYRALPRVTGPLKPGDLVFPADSFDSNGNPGHVIMYAGNGVCYAASKKGVPLGEVPLPKNYRAARWA